jgi:prenyltransferase beta subunit
MRVVVATGLCLLVVSGTAHGQSRADQESTIAYLHKLQNRDGGFLATAGAKISSLRATNGALRALKYFGGKPPDRDACAEFVKSCFDKDSGGFADAPGARRDVASTAVGLMALVELRIPTESYADAAVRYLGEHARNFEEIRIAAAGLEAVGKRPSQADDWLKEVARLRKPDGTFGTADNVSRDTGGATVVVLRLGGRVEDPKAVLATLDRGELPDGGFGKAGAAGSDLESTYRVVRCYYMLKAKPKAADKCREFIGRCRNADGGFGVAPSQPSSVACTYFAGILLHWLDEK